MYCAVFDVAAADGPAFGTLTLATTGKTSCVINLVALEGSSSSSLLWHHDTPYPQFFVSEDTAAVHRRTEISQYSFGVVLQTAIIAAMTANSWVTPSVAAVTFSRTTGHYTISYAAAAFTMAWSTAAGRALCGYSADHAVAATSFVGDVVPTYAILPTMTATSLSTPNQEASEIASHAVADDGSTAGISMEVAPIVRSWVQQYELKAKAIRLNAASTHPFTLQALREHCRTVYPFIVLDGFGDSYDEMFLFTGPGASWKPGRRQDGDDVQFHTPFECVVIGMLVANT